MKKTATKKKTPLKSAPASTRSQTEFDSNSAITWTFLTNHAHVLAVLHSDPELVLRHVAQKVGITERAVQRIIHELEEGGFIRREKVGRQNRYEVLLDKPLRHPIESHRKIGDLLKLINKSK